MPVLSPELKRLLECEPNASDAVAEIVANPSLIAQAMMAVPLLESAAKFPAGEDGVRDVIGRRFALFPQPDRSDGEWSAWWSDYYDALADLPLGSLEAAMGAYVKRHDAEFMPKPGLLRELAATTPSRSIQAYTRAVAAVNAAAAPSPRLNAPQTIDPPKMRQMTTEADRQAVKRMREQYDAEIDARPKPCSITQKPPPFGPIDEKGITPKMRAWLAENRGQSA